MGITLKSTILTVMIKTIRPSLLLVALLFSSLAKAQQVDYMQEYNAAKTNLGSENYVAALQGFTKLLSTDPAHKYSPYASYYYGVASYNLGEKEKAKDMFLQIARKYVDWSKLSETYLWLSKISFELGSPNQGIFYADKVAEDEELINSSSELKYHYISELDIPTLKLLLEEHEEDETIAQKLADKISTHPYNERDNDYFHDIIAKYNLDSTQLGLSIPLDIYKEKYRVAVMLPLFVDRLWHSGVYLQKSLAVEIYEGIKLAMNEFDSTRLELIVYDTKKDSLTTQQILQSDKLAEVDAVIGPLYPKPLALVSSYSNKNKKNFINPVSTNSDLIKHNPYAFLLRTGALSLGNIIADFAIDNIENKACAIYYGPRTTDTMVANNYTIRMELDSFYVAIKQQSQTDKAREIFDSLTSALPVVDSVELQRMWNAHERVRVLPKKDSLLLRLDSLGHIFIASDNKAIASEVMSAITSRGDTTQLIGVGNWFSTANASLSLMESLGVWLAMQEFENMLNPENIAIRSKYQAIYSQKPSKYVYYGYYAMKFLGESLLEYGVYFQNGYIKEGNIDSLFDYASSQDNGNLAIYELIDGVPVQLNASDLE